MSRAPDSDGDDSNSKEEDLAQAMYGGAGRQWGAGGDDASDEGATESSSETVDVVDQHEDVYVYECEIPDCDDAKRERFDEDHQVPEEIWERCDACGRDTFHRRRDLTDDGAGSCAHESVGLTGSDQNGDTVSENYSCTDCGAELSIHVDFSEEEAWMEVEGDG